MSDVFFGGNPLSSLPDLHVLLYIHVQYHEAVDMYATESAALPFSSSCSWLLRSEPYKYNYNEGGTVSYKQG
jgi:hypothetical protein